MENQMEKNKFAITPPKEGDDVLVGLAHKQAWLETYFDPDNGITENEIENLIGHVAEESGAEYRRNVFKEAELNPDKILYKVIRSDDGRVVGFMHCFKDEKYNQLGGLYILNEVKGQGVGDRLMQEFLDWSDKSKPCHLGVFATNERAIRFYEKYGFQKIDPAEPLYKETIPHIEMLKPVENKNAN